jgi:AcrR family transcriptional regulator
MTQATAEQTGRRTDRNGRTREPLTRERILDTALRFADEHSLQALSMRKLASELNVEAMSLYNHIDNKDDILASIADLVFAEVEIPSAESGDWDQHLRSVSDSAREALSRHTNVIPIILSGPNRGQAYLHMMESVVGTMRDAGFTADMAHHGWHTLVAHVLGYVLQETATPILLAASPARAAGSRSVSLGDLPSGDFPHIVEIAPLLAECETADEFEFGLDVILSGLAAKLVSANGG